MKTKLRLVGGLTAGLMLIGLAGCSSDSKTEEKTTETTAKAAEGADKTATTKAGETATTKAGATATTAKAAEATTTVKK